MVPGNSFDLEPLTPPVLFSLQSYTVTAKEALVMSPAQITVLFVGGNLDLRKCPLSVIAALEAKM